MWWVYEVWCSQLWTVCFRWIFYFWFCGKWCGEIWWKLSIYSYYSLPPCFFSNVIVLVVVPGKQTYGENKHFAYGWVKANSKMLSNILSIAVRICKWELFTTLMSETEWEREKSGCSGSEKGRLKKTTNGFKTVWYTRGTRERENKNEIIIIERVNSKYLYRVSMVNERNASSYSIYLYVYLRVLKAKWYR